MKSWRLADAKNRFDELITLAIAKGPQTIRGRQSTVVVVSEQEYKRLMNKEPSFKEYLTQGPSFEGLDLSREEKNTSRKKKSLSLRGYMKGSMKIKGDIVHSPKVDWHAGMS